MAVVSAATGTQLTVLNTEHSLTQQTNIVGIYILKVNVANMQNGDTL